MAAFRLCPATTPATAGLGIYYSGLPEPRIEAVGQAHPTVLPAELEDMFVYVCPLYIAGRTHTVSEGRLLLSLLIIRYVFAHCISDLVCCLSLQKPA